MDVELTEAEMRVMIILKREPMHGYKIIKAVGDEFCDADAVSWV